MSQYTGLRDFLGKTDEEMFERLDIPVEIGRTLFAGELLTNTDQEALSEPNKSEGENK